MIEFIQLNGGASAGSMAPLAGFSVSDFGAAEYSDSQGRMVAVTGASGAFAHGDSAGVMAPLTGLSGRAGYADSRGRMAPLEGLAYAGLAAPDYVIADTMMLPLTGIGIMMSGTIGQAVGAIAPLIGLSADRPYGEARAVLAPLTGFSGELTKGNFILDPRATRLTAQNERTERLNITSTSQATKIIPQEHTETLNIGDPRTTRLTALASNAHSLFVFSQDEGTNIVNVVIDGVPYTLPLVPPTNWCFNADTYAAARLEHHDFNSFVLHEGRYYASSDAGVFELGAAGRYDGVPVDSFIAFGRQDLGTEQLKRLIRAYLAGDSEGLLRLAVQDDRGSIYRYNAESNLATDAEARVVVGQGFKSTYYRLSLSNLQGQDFRLDLLKILVEALERRIR